MKNSKKCKNDNLKKIKLALAARKKFSDDPKKIKQFFQGTSSKSKQKFQKNSNFDYAF